TALREQPPTTLKDKALKELREWAVTLSIFVPLFMVFSGLVYELRVIPSESMVPNLQVGDRVAVNKFAYGYSRHSLPFSLGRYTPLPEGRIFAGEPERGDVIVFEHPHTERVMIKRLIGLPGDEVQIRDGAIWVDGAPLDRNFVQRIQYLRSDSRSLVAAREFRESDGEASWLSHDWEGQGGRFDNTPVFRVPEGHFLFMGDNRDNSTDGRALTGHCPMDAQGEISDAGCAPRAGISETDASVGYVPFSNLIGRADTVLFSTYRCSRAQASPCMRKRLWRGL
ncbi:MAG: signal peptidase I, partial [Pseudomonadota bacterium]